jgi:hypothetical protein
MRPEEAVRQLNTGDELSVMVATGQFGGSDPVSPNLTT